MSITIHCPTCSLPLIAQEADLGKPGKCSRCGSVFAITPPPPPPLPVPALSPPVESITPGLIRVSEGISRGFTLLHSNLVNFLLFGLCCLGVGFGMGLAAQVPCLGLFIWLGSILVLQPALQCGMYRACFRQHEGEQPEVADLFAEYSLWVDYLVITLLKMAFGIGLLLPGGAIVLVGFIPMFQGKPQPNWFVLATGVLVVIVFLAGLGMSFLFVYPALLHRRQGFWDAIRTSWRLMSSNVPGALGAFLLTSLLMIGGSLLCCIGTIYTLPASFSVIAAIYRTAMPGRVWGSPHALGSTPPSARPRPPNPQVHL